MASGTLRFEVDGKTARSAVAKAAKFLRRLLAKQENRDKLAHHGLLSKGVTAGNAIRDLQQIMLEQPAKFGELITVVSQLPEGSDAADKLREVSGWCIPAAKSTPLDDLRKKLKTMKELEVMTQQNEALYKRAIENGIAEALKNSIDVKIIQMELSNMHQERLISSLVLEWAVATVDKQQKGSSSQTDERFIYQCTPLELKNSHLHDASLCSMVVNKYDTYGCIKLFQSLSKVSLRKVSISHFQQRIAFPKCMIANVDDTFIVAFESHFDFEVWGKLSENVSKCTFGKGLEYLIENFPTLYFEALIKENKKVIITGFSFGGVLAHMLAAQLWQLPQLHSDQLMTNLLCITFGEPLIQSELLIKVAEVFPDFKTNVHAIFKHHDHFPFLLEELDAIACSNEELFPVILSELLCLQRLTCSRSDTNADWTVTVDQTSLTVKYSRSAQSTNQELETVVKKAQAAEYHLQHLLQSHRRKQHCFGAVVLTENVQTLTTYMIVQSQTSRGDLQILKYNMDKIKKEVATSDLTVNQFTNHSAGVYNKCVKIYVSAKEQHCSNEKSSTITTSDFLKPIVEKLQVTQYGDEATIVVRGKQLWFSHSVKVASAVKQPFQIQENSVSFSMNICDIRDLINDDSQEREICLYSYFASPVTTKVLIERNINHLTPRGKQLARLEPAHLFRLAFMMAMLEKQQIRLDGSSREFSPLFHHIRSFLHEIAKVVPYESMLCTVAYGRHKATVDHCASLIAKNEIEFPFSLLMHTCILVALSKTHGIISDEQNPIEDSAYFSWLSLKLFLKKYMKKMIEMEFLDSDFSIRDIPFIFKAGFVGMSTIGSTFSVSKQEDSSMKYLAQLAESALVEDETQTSAICDKSVVDLYTSGSLKSPVTVLNEGRKKLALMSTSCDCDSEEIKVMSFVNSACGEEFNCCISVLCGFMYQHCRIPFTEENPVTVFKSVRLYAGPLWTSLKRSFKKEVIDGDSNDDDDLDELFHPPTLISVTKKCRKMVAKGTQIAEHMYDGKLRFLVSNIDKSAVANIAPSSSEYIIYALEQKLMELCLTRDITKKTLVDDIVKEWAHYFKGCPLLDVSKSHRSLIARWIKWSLMVTELRGTLETYTTITVSGLVNSGKSQLMRGLFGLDVKAGTTESRRTTVPFIYSLDPDVPGVNVIDFPGVDDNDQDVIKPVEFLKFISQIVIFVIHYSKAHTLAAKEWLKRFEVTEGGSEEEMKLMRENLHSVMSDLHYESRKIGGQKVPVLICLTFTDRLLARDFMNDSGKYDIGEAKKGIAKHFEDISNKVYNQGVWNPQDRRTIGYYCFRLDKRTTLSEDDMRKVGIGVPLDVGNWICKQLKDELHMPDAAGQLQKYFTKSFRNLKC